MTESGHLLQNLIQFGRTLHKNGMDVNTRQLMVLVHALEHIRITDKSDFYHTCRSVLVHRKKHIPLFDQIFEEFWRHPGKRSFALPLPRSRMSDTLSYSDPTLSNVPAPSTDDRADSDDQSDAHTTKSYSSREVLRKKDFAHLTPSEMDKVKKMMRDLVLKIGKRRSRRWRFEGRKRQELRRTLRKNVQYGGNVLEWVRLDPKWKPRPIIVLADVSGSMETYTEMLLHFLLGLSTSLRNMEAFVFSTRLTRITSYLHQNDPDATLRKISKSVPDWSSGTRIGAAIKQFNFKWARRVLHSGAMVLLISDGWDRGEPALLGAQLARLQRSCHRLIWLNPLLGVPEYEPLTRGMSAALPFIDDFRPVHNLASLEDLGQHLLLIPQSRPLRRQQHYHYELREDQAQHLVSSSHPLSKVNDT